MAQLQTVAKTLGGACLSTEYRNNRVKLRWKCNENHEWEAAPESVKSGQWCPFCAGKRLWSPGLTEAEARLKECHSLAANRGGQFLSNQYLGAVAKYKWRCGRNHEWEAVLDSVKRGVWCPFCARNRLWSPDRPEAEARLDECRKIAASNGGECLSDVYTNDSTKMRWRCAEGHEWEAVPGHIRRSSVWCPRCAFDRTADSLRGSIKECQEIAVSRGGVCLSEIYQNNNSKLRWRCSDGHEWDAVLGSIKSGTWCPYCSFGLNEELTRGILERITNETWPKAKPIWLKNSDGNQMELDGFCQRLQIAFEYHGGQHYDFVQAFHGTFDKFERRKADDELKRTLCKKHGIGLLEIPYTVNSDDLIDFLADALGTTLDLEITVPIGLTLDGLGYDRGELVKLREIALAKGGACLSTTYRGSSGSHRWRCAEGHEWEAKEGPIAKGICWCPFCSKRRLWSPGKTEAEARLDECRNMAVSKGGECMSGAYTNENAKMRWRCAEGHEWEAVPGPIRRNGVWCPKCKGRKIWVTRRSNSKPS